MLLLPVVLRDVALKTGGRVVAAGGVVTERIKTNSRIAVAGCQAKKRKIPLGGVAVGIASVRCRIYRFRKPSGQSASVNAPSVSATRMIADRERRIVRSEFLEVITVFMAVISLRFGFCFGFPPAGLCCVYRFMCVSGEAA